MYVPLRVHGHHSLLTGIDPPSLLVERALALGLPALALADVDQIAGLVDFLQAAGRSQAAETSGAGGPPSLRPIVAAELSDPDRDTGGVRVGRLIALVENEEGYRNLCRLITARQVDRVRSAHGKGPGVSSSSSEEEDDGDERFDLIQAAALHQEGLLFLADGVSYWLMLGMSRIIR